MGCSGSPIFFAIALYLLLHPAALPAKSPSLRDWF